MTKLLLHSSKWFESAAIMSIAKSPGSDFDVDPNYDLSGLDGFPIYMTAGTEEVPYLKATERAYDFFDS